MKRIILLCMLLVAGMVKAQVPNGSLQNWKSFSFGMMSFTYPENFLTSNFSVFQGSDPSVTEVNGVNGGKAAAITTVSYEEDGQTEIMSGFLTSLKGEFSIDPSTWNNKFAVTGKPEKFEGYYTFAPVDGDTFSFVVVFYQNGMPVGTVEFSDNTPKNSFTKFSLPVDYTLPSAQPDSASITILSSSNEEIHEGTQLVIDELSFKMPGGYSLGIAMNDAFTATVYPNPATNDLTIEFNVSMANASIIELFDLSGKVLKTVDVDANVSSASFDISSLPKGAFYGRIISGAEVKTFKAIKI